MIKNKKTGQIYIGQSKNIETRFKKHCQVRLVDIAIANEGVENFEFKIIEEVPEDKLNQSEQYWIQYYNAYENIEHYNMHPGGYVTAGHFNPRAKYTLWDINCCTYFKEDGGVLRKRFSAKYNTYRIPIGRFHDFVSCEIINQLIKEAIKDEVK